MRPYKAARGMHVNVKPNRSGSSRYLPGIAEDYSVALG